MEAKAEFYSLMLKVAFNKSVEEVVLFVDLSTFHGFYSKWLASLSLDLSSAGNDKLKFLIVDHRAKRAYEIIDDNPADLDYVFNKKEYLEAWWKGVDSEVDKFINNRKDVCELSGDIPSDIYCYQKSQSDCITELNES